MRTQDGFNAVWGQLENHRTTQRCSPLAASGLLEAEVSGCITVRLGAKHVPDSVLLMVPVPSVRAEQKSHWEQHQ